MRERPVVFLGSSLAVKDAARILDADYRPPIKRGDIDALLDDPPPAIGIIDGEFFQSLAISPKEILHALEKNVPTYGASSMGALRAVELAPYGMIGIGTVYEHYRTCAVDADDEVAVTYSPTDHQPLSEAMINIRIALKQAAAERVITERDCEHLIGMAKRTYFPDRSYANLWRKAEKRLPERTLSVLRSYIAERKPDAKRDDAKLMLSELNAFVSHRRLSAF